MSKPVAFVSYSHKDETEKDQLVSQLGVLENAGAIELWIDDRIEGGADWEVEIKQAIAKAKVAILLISANFLTSDFILGKEVPAFLERREREGMIVFPVIAKPCSWKAFDWLARMNVRPKNGRPIWSGTSGKIDEDLAKIAQEVAEIAKKEDTIRNPIVTAAGSTPPASSSPVTTQSDRDRQHLEKMLDTSTRRLYHLQQQAAMYGISAPPEIQIEIEDLEVEIAELKQKLNA
jgi:hypothetical protein